MLFTPVIFPFAMLIRPATAESDLDSARVLFREYQAELNVDLCFQSFEEELAGLPGKYAPPEGRLLLAFEGTQPVGCVALRPHSETRCEMKRLYVRPAARGTGLGRELAIRIVDEARQIGYREVVLDTLDRLRPALKLYRSMGFRDVPAYYHNPLAGVVFLKVDL